MAATLVTSRICRCGCGESFTPNPKHPGQEYKYGHKPKDEPRAKRLGVEPPREKERALLDYRLTAATLRRQIELLDKEIDGLDDEIDLARKTVAAAQARKDWAVDRHAGMIVAVQTLEALIHDQPIPVLVGTVQVA